jgi:site-specific recombinase XerD
MNQIVSIRSDLQVSETLAAKFRADKTIVSYQTGAKQFAEYCKINGLCPLPAEPHAVNAFIAHLSKQGKSVGTIKARVAAIGWVHKTAGHWSPTADATVEMVLAGLTRTVNRPIKQAKPMLASTTKAIIDAIAADDVRAVRDRALVLLAFFGAFRRSELVQIRREDLEFTDEGVSVYLAKSKTDQEGNGRWVAISRQDNDYCPVDALEDHLLETDSERVFDISDRMVDKIIKKLSVRAGFDPAEYSPHSLRAGMVTQASLNNVAKRDIRRITGHKTDAMIDRYTRVTDQWKNNATRGLMG